MKNIKIYFTFLITMIIGNFAFSQSSVDFKLKAHNWVEEKVNSRIILVNPDLKLSEEQRESLAAAKILDFEQLEKINKSTLSTEEKQKESQKIYAGIYQLLVNNLTPEQVQAWVDSKSINK